MGSENHIQPFERLLLYLSGDSGPTGADVAEDEIAIAFEALLIAAGQPNLRGKAIESLLKAVTDLTSLRNKQLLAACFLRLLPHRALGFLRVQPWRQRVVALVEEQCAETLYRDKNLNASLQAHEKLAGVAKLVSEQDGRLRSAINMLTSFDQLNAHRQRLMRVLNSELGKILHQPFLPEDIGPRLLDLFKHVEDYIDKRDDLAVIDAQRELAERACQLADDLEVQGSQYAVALAQGVARKIQELLEEDFGRNKAVQPGHVVLRTRSKKYPLRDVGRDLTLRLVVENTGPGFAHEVRLTLDSDDLEFASPDIGIGRLPPGRSHSVDAHCRVIRSQSTSDVLAEISWLDFDQTTHSDTALITVGAQRTGIDWDSAAAADPYSLEPVTSDDQLMGRREALNRLVGSIRAPSAGSWIITGQKRVGKTSIGKALLSRLDNNSFIPVYLEGGDYVHPTAEATIARLGQLLCRQLSLGDARLRSLAVPSFSDALTPFVDFADDVLRTVPDRGIVIILDEFDELPLALYMRGPVGDAFFLTLRAISSRSRISFVLIGGEKMTHILDCQGDQLNKWGVIRVDYFSRDRDWSDYRELIARPVNDVLDFDGGAIVALHELTAGNPYFTKLICRYVYRQSVDRRDSYVTATEVGEAAHATAAEADRNTFQHFWEDGIFETPGLGEEKSIRRRRVLIAVADALHGKDAVSLADVEKHPVTRDLTAIDLELQEFASRNVLTMSGAGQAALWGFKVPFFASWLKERGVHDVISTFTELDASLRERESEERLRVSSGEIVDLATAWPTYRGQRVGEERIRAWLEQFGGVREQRAMFAVLKQVRFYTSAFVQEGMRDVDRVVRRGGDVIERRVAGKLKRSEVLVSYLDSPAKSGAHFARLYAEEARIYIDNIVEKGVLAEAVSRGEVQALVFVDDFVGTGESAATCLRELDEAIGQTVIDRKLKVVFAAVVAYKSGWTRLEGLASDLTMDVDMHAVELLGDEACVFGKESGAFRDDQERQLAEHLSRYFGTKLEKRCPMGYGDQQLTVLFERGCPNNSLPVLWSAAESWVPLFPRH